MIVRSAANKPMTSAQNIANELLCHHVTFQCLLRQSEMYCTALVRMIINFVQITNILLSSEMSPFFIRAKKSSISLSFIRRDILKCQEN
ncbi:hypothetical protein TNCV_4415801 [Trichonephila clavipes]|uniref:Uncharacterized protein n=1 Tax=Trichonephila clavipes TaxID=2585209 RepID=A0A8X6V4I2_TRICX|nr:hypothetical protein TNCV_4415801 [Trichonephila clavipes]